MLQHGEKTTSNDERVVIDGCPLASTNSIDDKIKESLINSTSDWSTSLQLPKEFLPRPKNVMENIANWYFTPFNFEKFHNGRIYELLGVRLFKYFLPTGGDLVQRWTGIHEIRGGADTDLSRYEPVTRFREMAHVIGAAMTTSLTIAAFALNSISVASFSIGVNLFVNIYPIMVQRYNRTRINSILLRREERQNFSNQHGSPLD
jgi:glycosyl-4,4'-diaponeurosporenoate acyltransferase